MRRRVVITGVGTISSAGKDNEGFTQALLEGRQCFSRIEDSRLRNLKATHAGFVENFENRKEDPKKIQVLDRNTHLALNAMRQAIENAGLKDVALGNRSAVVMGTCSGGMLSVEKHYEGVVEGAKGIDPDLRFSRRYYTTSKVLAWAAGVGGPALTVVTACAAGSGAIASGADLVRVGMVDRALVGGSDTFAPSTVVGFDALKATCRGTCSPFSSNVGLNLGEGAAFFVLEEAGFAVERGATVLAEVLGYGMSNDAYHPTAPDPSLKGQVASMERALADAGIDPIEVDYINAHGTGTRANDPIESRGIARVFGSAVESIPVSSTKSIVGHCLGAAGVMEAAGTILAARKGFIPSTAGFDEKREGCHLGDYVPDPGRKWKGSIALSNSFGFGGNNATVVFDVAPQLSKKRSSGTRDKLRPVITGLGVVSPFGYGTQAILDGEEEGSSKFTEIKGSVPGVMGGMVTHTDPRGVDRRLDLRGMDRCATFVTLATSMALMNGGLKTRPREMASVGMILGIAAGPSKGEADHVQEVLRTQCALDRLGAFPYVVPNSVSGHVARTLFLRGYNTVLAAGLGAGLAALGSGVAAITLGHAEKIIAASSDELSPAVLADGVSAGIFGPKTGRAPGEGACALLVEDGAMANKRGARPLAEVLGYGMCTDNHNPREGGGDSLARATQQALLQAELEKDEIDFLSETRTDVFAKEYKSDLEKGPPNGRFSLLERIGLAEATTPLFDLSVLVQKAKCNETILVASLSPEGFGYAVVVKKK